MKKTKKETSGRQHLLIAFAAAGLCLTANAAAFATENNNDNTQATPAPVTLSEEEIQARYEEVMARARATSQNLDNLPPRQDQRNFISRALSPNRVGLAAMGAVSRNGEGAGDGYRFLGTAVAAASLDYYLNRDQRAIESSLRQEREMCADLVRMQEREDRIGSGYSVYMPTRCLN